MTPLRSQSVPSYGIKPAHHADFSPDPDKLKNVCGKNAEKLSGLTNQISMKI